jgi:hypothetical protein
MFLAGGEADLVDDALFGRQVAQVDLTIHQSLYRISFTVGISRKRFNASNIV